jgi:hypothetical protein
MPSSLNGTGVTFNDGTTQSTAATASNYIMLTYTSPATWTKPAGLKAVKVTVIGGGGGTAGVGPAPTIPSQLATPGGTSSFGGFLSATGGVGAPRSNSTQYIGGVGSGGDLNIGSYNFREGYGGGTLVGATLIGGTQALSPSPGGSAGKPYGGGAMQSFNGAASSGGSSVKYISAPTVPGPVSVTVGAGGVPTGPAVPSGFTGADGVVIVEEFY